MLKEHKENINVDKKLKKKFRASRGAFKRISPYCYSEQVRGIVRKLNIENSKYQY